MTLFESVENFLSDQSKETAQYISSSTENVHCFLQGLFGSGVIVLEMD